MIRNLKVLGLAVVAVLAMSVMASAAQAAEFHSEAESTTFSGSQVTQNVFTAGGSEVKCNTAEFTGSQTGTSVAEVEVQPTYSSCTAFGFAKAHVKTAGCKYAFTASSSTAGAARVACSGTSKIEITPTFLGSSVCTIKIGSQTPGTPSVDYANEGSGSSRSITVTATVGGISFEEVSGGGCGVGSGSNGTYTGSVHETGSAGIWVE